jgi:hypothetical protein
LNDGQKKLLVERFRKFEQSVDTAMKEFPAQVRKFSSGTVVDLTKVKDEQLLSGLVWQNIKLDYSGNIECYTHNKNVSQDFDIVITFSPSIRIIDIGFDG